MNFREFINLSEQGTPTSVTGLNAAGRAGQNPFSPEKALKKMPNPFASNAKDHQIQVPKTIAKSYYADKPSTPKSNVSSPVPTKSFKAQQFQRFLPQKGSGTVIKAPTQ